MVWVRAPQFGGSVSTTEPTGCTAPRSAVSVCGQAAPSWLSQYEPLLPSFALDAGNPAERAARGERRGECEVLRRGDSAATADRIGVAEQLHGLRALAAPIANDPCVSPSAVGVKETSTIHQPATASVVPHGCCGSVVTVNPAEGVTVPSVVEALAVLTMATRWTGDAWPTAAASNVVVPG